MRERRLIAVIILGGTLMVLAPAKADDAPPRPGTKFAPKALGMELPVIESEKELDKYVGRLVAVRGVVRNTKLPNIFGVDIRVADELRRSESEVYAVGILVKFVVTEEQVRKSQEEAARRTGNLVGLPRPGLGTHYSLYVDLKGKLAEARPLPK